MHQGTTIINAEELFGNVSHAGASQDAADDFETYWEWMEEIGRGHMSMINLRKGLFIEIGHFRLKDDIAVSFEQPRPLIVFGYGVSGGLRYTTETEKDKNEYWFSKEGHSIIGYMPKSGSNIVRPSSGDGGYFIHIAIDPSLLQNFLDEQRDQIPIDLHKILNGSRDQYFYHSSVISPFCNMAIRQIINCPYRSSLKRLLLEGKALELVSHSLAQVISEPLAIIQNRELRPDDMERVIEARNILLRNLDDPPSQLELARMVGTNKTTLNKGFRRIFGTSAFEYLRICRLERARELLGSREMNVSEVAIHVGYSHQTSFTRAFKNYFGTYPTDHFH